MEWVWGLVGIHTGYGRNMDLEHTPRLNNDDED